jgi:hypothetical protein
MCRAPFDETAETAFKEAVEKIRESERMRKIGRIGEIEERQACKALERTLSLDENHLWAKVLLGEMLVLRS